MVLGGVTVGMLGASLPAVLTVAGVVMIIPVATAATILAVGSAIYEATRCEDEED